MKDRVISDREQFLRDLSPTKYPDIAYLLGKIDRQWNALRGMQCKIERQRNAITKVQTVSAQWKQSTLDLTAEVERLKEENARLRAALEDDR
ncbi:hypothetical protein ACWGIR_23175 [Streptomyces albidoflavus]